MTIQGPSEIFQRVRLEKPFVAEFHLRCQEDRNLSNHGHGWIGVD